MTLPRTHDSGSILVDTTGGSAVRLLRRHPSAALVHRYFSSLRDADHLVAFDCLSGAADAFGGAGPERSSFVREQADIDEAQGRLTTFSIRNRSMVAGSFWSLRMAKASYLVRLARGGDTTDVYPYVVVENGQWRIFRFDPHWISLTN